LENELFEEKENHMRLLKDLDRKEIELLSINKDIERMKEVYENKISLLNTKINSEEDTLSELKLEIKNKNENIKVLNNNIHENKNKMKNMKTQMEMKNDEIINIKKEYEKLINSKDKKINELKTIINQSFYSLNSGLNNIKIANKLDDEVKVLMKRAKVDDNEN
jgi:exonuclease SbcC